MSGGRTYSVFIPAYNAEKTLRGVIDRIPPEVWDNAASVWVINDGSTDGTGDVIEAVARERGKVNGVLLEKNRGYGGAVKEGLRRIRGEGVDVAVCIHADGQYAPEEAPRLLDELWRRDLDVLQGSRISGGGALRGGMPVYKYAAGKVLTAMENAVFGMRMTDYHSGYMLYGERALNRIPFDELSASFDFDLEVIATARAAGMRVGEAPIPTHYGDEVSHLRPVTYGLRVLGVLARYIRGRYKSIYVQHNT